jgi:DNA-binding PucR family transcriptional regulator
VIEAVEALVEDRDELVLTLEAVMAYLFSQGDGASQAALRTHVASLDVWLRGRGAGLSKRLDAVLDRTVTDVQVAERTLNYAVSGNHVAVIAWLDDPARPLDAAEAQRRVAVLPGVRDALLVPRDERTLYAWLHVAGDERIAHWMGMLGDLEQARIAFGEIAHGIEGFRTSHAQARAAGAVIAASRKRQSNTVVRYRDVATLSFIVDRPAESKAWSQALLGDLAGPGEDRETLRETLRVFLEEGESAVETGKRLFVHRNTVKYRVDRASSLLPEALGTRRVDVALALRYIDLVGPGA